MQGDTAATPTTWGPTSLSDEYHPENAEVGGQIERDPPGGEVTTMANTIDDGGGSGTGGGTPTGVWFNWQVLALVALVGVYLARRD